MNKKYPQSFGVMVTFGKKEEELAKWVDEQCKRECRTRSGWFKDQIREQYLLFSEGKLIPSVSSEHEFNYVVNLPTDRWKAIARALHRTLDNVHGHPDDVISKIDLRTLDRFLNNLDQNYFKGKLLERED